MIIILIILLSGQYIHAQENPVQDDFRKNTISYEIGLWHRGLSGISYARNFLRTKYTFCAVEVYGGLGVSWEDFNKYAGFSPVFNLGKKEAFFTMGLDFKYYSITEGGFLFDQSQTYSGFSYAPMLGFHFVFHNGFTFKGRTSFIHGEHELTSNETISKQWIGGGLSLGYSF